MNIHGFECISKVKIYAKPPYTFTLSVLSSLKTSMKDKRDDRTQMTATELVRPGNDSFGVRALQTNARTRMHE